MDDAGINRLTLETTPAVESQLLARWPGRADQFSGCVTNPGPENLEYGTLYGVPEDEHGLRRPPRGAYSIGSPRICGTTPATRGGRPVLPVTSLPQQELFKGGAARARFAAS